MFMKIFDWLILFFISLLGFIWSLGTDNEWLWGFILIVCMICVLVAVYKAEHKKQVVDPEHLTKTLNTITKSIQANDIDLRKQIINQLSYLQELNNQQIKINADYEQIKQLVNLLLEALEIPPESTQFNSEYNLASENKNTSEINIFNEKEQLDNDAKL